MAHHSSNRKRRSESGSPTSAAKRNKDAVNSPVDDKENESARNPLEDVASPSQHSSHEEDEEEQAVVAASVSDAMDEDGDAVAEDASEDEAAATIEEEEEAAEDEEQADVTAAQARGRKSNNSSKFGKPAEAGIIKEVYVENFMCHRKLRVQLNRNVNFIHGQNGSGKSAVLAAIQICLGANARRTNRARNMKDLVRKDAASGSMPTCAKIRVTILNQGSDAYKPDLYGDKITIEKTISLVGGNSGFKLLDENGKKVSDSKKDLNSMLDTLNIQVENPVAVLDQEEAKKFLTGKAEDKYAFFMKATELERVDRTYADTVDKVHTLDAMNENSRKLLQGSFARVDELKRKWKEHQQMDELETKLQKLNTEFGWAIYNECDEKYTAAVASMEKFVAKAEKCLEDVTQAEASLSSPEEEEQDNRAKMEKLIAEAQEQMNLQKELEMELKTSSAPLKQLDREITQLKRQQKVASEELKASQRRLQQARDQIIANADSAQSEEARRTARLKKAEEELSVARNKADTLKQETITNLHAYEELEPSVREATSKINSLKSQLSGVQNTLRSLSSSNGDSLAILGPRVSKVAQLVESAKQQNKFRGPVAGPIFTHLKIAPGKEQYAGLAETAIGPGVLDRFVVTNDHDNKLLRRIRQQAGCNQDCGIYQIHPNSTKERFNVPSPPSVDGIETIASVLSVDSPMVFNCLVDNAKIERKVVARNLELSERHLLVNNGGGNQIRGPYDHVYYLPKGDYWQVKGGTRANFSNDKPIRNTIGVDKSAAIEESRREEARLNKELVEKTANEAKLQHEHLRYQREWNKTKKAMKENLTLIAEISEKIEQIKDEMEASASVTIDTSEYEEEVAQAEEAIDKFRHSEQKLSAQRDELLPRIAEIRSQLDETIVRNQKVRDEISDAENQLTQLLETQTQQKSQLAKKREKLEKYRTVVASHEQNIEGFVAEREIALRKARKLQFRYQQRLDSANRVTENVQLEVPPEEFSQDATTEDLEAIEPITVRHEPEHYEARIKNAQRKIEQERARRKVSGEDPAVAFEKFQTAKREYNKLLASIEATERSNEALKKDLKRRQKRWSQFRSHLSLTTGLKFNEMLQLNKYTGSLEFQHESGTLDLAVAKSSQGETKDVKALSGGERSYTTMCLLLALGETLETPFRILDEFDVFLDAEVRKLTIQSLIHVAKKMKHRQFIFITPQDLSSVQTDPEVTIRKLENPFRHQVAGGPSQQTLNFSQVAVSEGT